MQFLDKRKSYKITLNLKGLAQSKDEKHSSIDNML